MMKKIFVVLSVGLITAVLFSCNKKDENVIDIAEAVPLSLAPDVNWAVINEPYAAYKNEKNWDSDTTSYSKKGDILQVLGKSTDEDGNEWYKFEKGWLPSSCLTVYSNRYKAQKVAEGFKK